MPMSTTWWLSLATFLQAVDKRMLSEWLLGIEFPSIEAGCEYFKKYVTLRNQEGAFKKEQPGPRGLMLMYQETHPPDEPKYERPNREMERDEDKETWEDPTTGESLPEGLPERTWEYYPECPPDYTEEDEWSGDNEEPEMMTYESPRSLFIVNRKPSSDKDKKGTKKTREWFKLRQKKGDDELRMKVNMIYSEEKNKSLKGCDLCIDLKKCICADKETLCSACGFYWHTSQDPKECEQRYQRLKASGRLRPKSRQQNRTAGGGGEYKRDWRKTSNSPKN